MTRFRWREFCLPVALPLACILGTLGCNRAEKVEERLLPGASERVPANMSAKRGTPSNPQGRRLPDGSCPLAWPYCGGDFPLNQKKTTPYGPPWADIIGVEVPCYGPYTLCHYATCTLDSPEASVSNCACLPWFGLNFVGLNSILNEDVYKETVRACGADGQGCTAPNTAPVCKAINDGTFYSAPIAGTVSTFSFHEWRGKGADCDASPGLYAGCMTAACNVPRKADKKNGDTPTNCRCPIFKGPYQVGEPDSSRPGAPKVMCDISPELHSGSYSPPGAKRPSGQCVPDAGVPGKNKMACPLYKQGVKLPANSGVNCALVCKEYADCKNPEGVELLFTCDAVLVSSKTLNLVTAACDGVQFCDLTEAYAVKVAAGCSGCASQLCNCKPSPKTNAALAAVTALQRDAGEVPQCAENGYLCGMPAP